jgi:CRISPR/Cas system CSM-associated protein Csm3 (group 7 of RAMP superfamily)
VPRTLDDTSIRRLRALWVIQGRLRLSSAAHFGGKDDGPAGAMIVRDRKDGRPLLPGTTLAGSLRSYLADRLGGYGSSEDARVGQLFGSAGNLTDPGWQSPIVMYDGIADATATEIRDGVCLDPARGIAEAHFKYEIEVLPAGTTFPFRLDLLIAGDADEDQMLGLVATVTSGLAAGDIALGVKRTRGLGGLVGEEFKARRFDLSTESGWREWASSDWEQPIGSKATAWPPPGLAADDHRRRVVAEATLDLDGPLLIGSPGLTPDAPDSVHIESGGRSIVPGTSLAGALRQRALRIATLVRAKQGDGEAFIDGLFGPRGPGVALHASRLRISEAAISSSPSSTHPDDEWRERTTRIRVDRLTQGVTTGAMLEEEVRVGGRFIVNFELRDPKPGESGLLLLLLKDLLSGDLAIGGTVAAGRGALHGDGWVQPVEATRRLELSKSNDVNAITLDQLVRELHDAPPLPPTKKAKAGR